MAKIESTPAMISAPDLVSQVEKMIAESEHEGDETLRELAARIVALMTASTVEIDKWRVFGPQRSGANIWRLDGWVGGISHNYLPRTEPPSATSRHEKAKKL